MESVPSEAFRFWIFEITWHVAKGPRKRLRLEDLSTEASRRFRARFRDKASSWYSRIPSEVFSLQAAAMAVDAPETQEIPEKPYPKKIQEAKVNSQSFRKQIYQPRDLK